jgi:hypothetical protein
MNRYRELPLPQEVGEQPISLHHDQLDLGIRGDLKARQLPEGSSPNLWDIRFERGGFRKDFGEVYLGQSAPTDILVIVEHKFISMEGGNARQFHRLIRLFRNVLGQAELQIWNANAEQWVFGGIAVNHLTDSPTRIQTRYVRAVSVQNVLLFAVMGASILIREESPILDPREDFFDNEQLNEEGESTVAIFSAIEEVYFNRFIAHFNATLHLLEVGTLEVEIIVEVAGEELGSTTLIIDRPPETDPVDIMDIEIPFIAQLELGDEVHLKIKRIKSFNPSILDSEDLLTSGEEVEFQTPAIDTVSIDNDEYTWYWTVEYQGIGAQSTWWLYHYDASEDEWIFLDEVNVAATSTSMNHSHTLELPQVEEGDRFGLRFLSATSDVGYDGDRVEWASGEAEYEVTVIGENITYDAIIGTELDFYETNGPEALWIESFADRVVALCDGPDTQMLWWTPSGEVDNWDPTAVGAGNMALFDTRNDPIDDLQCAAPLSSDSLAIFRARSIMRAFRTGQSVQAIGVNHWLENIGTESPFSRQVTPIGIIFLGHDRMVYVLTESGIRPVGLPIHQLLVERLTDNLHKVDTVFDPVFQYYYLGIPVFGSEKICEVYILDVGRLMNEDKVVWRRRSCGGGLERFGIASQL